MKVRRHAQLWYIEEYEDLQVKHGGIAHRDIEKILDEMGGKKISLPFRTSFSFFAKLRRLFQVIINYRKIPRGSAIVYQFPLYAKFNRVLVNWLLGTKNVRVICCILDINGLKSGNVDLLRKEISVLKKHEYFIVHNESMETWVKKQVPAANVSRLELFDFLTRPNLSPRVTSHEICFAGNLAKSGFLHKLAAFSTLRFHLFGPGFHAGMQTSNVEYHGEFNPYELPRLLKGSYGLVWDGEAVDGAGGPLGTYMQFIAHHKVSLYILSGMPIFIYAKAGAAELVHRLQIGFLIDHLNEIPSIIDRTSQSDYQQMVANMQALAKSISTGQHFRTALNQLLDKD